MSRDDYETNKTLITPHIEIGLGHESQPTLRAYVNVETFRKCLGKMTPPTNDRGPVIPGQPFYSIYGVVARSVPSMAGDSYVNIGEPPISRTLMGFLEQSVVEENLPRTFKFLKHQEELEARDSKLILDGLRSFEKDSLEEEDYEESPFPTDPELNQPYADA